MKLCEQCREKLNEGSDFSELCYGCLDKLTVRQVNKLARQTDQSHRYPIRNRFNVTERAIRQLRRAQRNGLVLNPGLEYALALDNEISHIVNSV